jgi:hypothetical protein
MEIWWSAWGTSGKSMNSMTNPRSEESFKFDSRLLKITVFDMLALMIAALDITVVNVAQRSEAFHHPFPDPGRLMRVLSPVNEVLGASMGYRRQKLAVCDLVAGQLAGHQHTRHVPQGLEQFTEEPLGCFGVSPRLHQDVEHVAVLVDRAPQVMGGDVGLDENLVEVPFVAGAGSPPTQLVGVVRPEPGTPGTDRLVGDPTHQKFRLETL